MQAAAGTNPQGNGAIYFALNHAVLSWTPQPITSLLRGSCKGEPRPFQYLERQKQVFFFKKKPFNQGLSSIILYDVLGPPLHRGLGL